MSRKRITLDFTKGNIFVFIILIGLILLFPVLFFALVILGFVIFFLWVEDKGREQ